MSFRELRLRQLLLIAVPLLVISAVLSYWLFARPFVSTENAYVKADIVHVSPEVGGRVVSVAIKDHAQVSKDDVLVQIDRHAYELALAKADAELEQAIVQVETLRATWIEAQMELKEAESKVTFTEQQLSRQKQLAGRGVATTVKVEEVENNAIAARDRVQVLRQKVARTSAALGGDSKLPADRHGLVREKSAARDRAKFDLAQTTIRAPVGGVAVGVKVQPGEQAKAATPLFAIVAEQRPWVEANFKETDLTHVRPGHLAEVVLDFYPDQVWQAVVESVSPATGAEFAILPPQNASGNWVKIVQRLPVRLRLLQRPGEPALRAGMTAQVSIDTGRERRISTMLRWKDADAQAAPVRR
jgi:membrane fusion protein (multidrug efflux system)